MKPPGTLGMTLPTRGRTGHDLTGKRFGQLVVTHRLRNPDGTCGPGMCQCDCGLTHRAAARHLVCGMVRSCGCLRSGFGRARPGGLFSASELRLLRLSDRAEGGGLAFGNFHRPHKRKQAGKGPGSTGGMGP